MNTIIEPNMAYRFKVEFPISKRYEKLTAQVMSCEFDYVAKTIEIKFRDDCLGHAASLLYDLSWDNKGSIDLIKFVPIDRSGNENLSTTYRVKGIEHSLKYDYSEAGFAYHHCKFKIDSIQYL